MSEREQPILRTVDGVDTKGPSASYAHNTCRLCAPLGATLVFRGIRGGMPYLHGSQGCATYIRRYLISHFREPVDVASSSFSEDTTIFGGRANFRQGLENIEAQYAPELVGVATTCLSETIGEDVGALVREATRAQDDGARDDGARDDGVRDDGARDDEARDDEARVERVPAPALVHVSTPSYAANHADGFHASVRAVVEQMTGKGTRLSSGATDDAILNVLPGMISPEDLRDLRRLVLAYGLRPVMLPDYADTLDGGTWDGYQEIPRGGTSLEEIRGMIQAAGTVELGRTLAAEDGDTAGRYLRRTHGVPLFQLGTPIGLSETDALVGCLASFGRKDAAQEEALRATRARLLDAYIDGHKIASRARVVVVAEDDLAVGLVSFLDEIGAEVVLCASGGKRGRLERAIACLGREKLSNVPVMSDADYARIDEACDELRPDLLIGASKAYGTARRLDVPLLRVGFPIHDRFGGQRVHHVGYDGALALYDRFVNSLLESRQARSKIGYSYM